MAETLEELLALLDDDGDEPEVDWDAVVSRLGSHPHEATITVDFHRTLLHQALTQHKNHNPFTVGILNAFIDAYKDPVFEVDENNDTPLHMACCFGASAEVVQVSLRHASWYNQGS